MADLSAAIVPFTEIALYALLNPAHIAVSFFLGRKANEAVKIGIAAFAGAAAGTLLLYVLALLGIMDAPVAARAAGGIFILSCFTGLVYGGLGYMTRPR